MKLFVQVLLLLWFVAVSALVIIPSALLLYPMVDPAIVDLTPPRPPRPPVLSPIPDSATGDDLVKRVARVEQEVIAYGHRVNAYEKEVAAHKDTVEAVKSLDPVSVYKAVVKDTFVDLLGKVLATLLAFAFVKVTGQAVTNAFAAKHHETGAIREIRFF